MNDEMLLRRFMKWLAVEKGLRLAEVIDHPVHRDEPGWYKGKIYPLVAEFLAGDPR